MLKLEPVKPARIEDHLRLILEFNRMEQITTPTPLIRSALERLLGRPELGRAWFILPDGEDGELAGYVNLTFGFDLEYAGRDAWITDFYIRPPYQGRGIGSRALALLELEARGLGAGAIHLMVRPDNLHAQSLYRRHGFEPNPRQAWIRILR